MNCQKLYKDIERLKSLRDELKDKYDASVESGLGKIALQKVSEQVYANTDKVLGEYLDDFFEHNPELLKFEVGDLIPGFEGVGKSRKIHSLTTLPDGSVMAGGGDSALYNITKDQDGNWQVGNLIPGFKDANNHLVDINTITPLPDGSLMAAGDGLGVLYNITKDQDGNWQVGNSVEGADDENTIIDSLVALPDGSVMAGGIHGALYNITKDQNGNWQIGDLIPGFKDANNNLVDIDTITPLPDGSVMAGGENGVIRNITKDQDGNWQVGNLIPGFGSEYDHTAFIISLATLSDGSVMAGDHDGFLYHIIKDQDGNWQMGDLLQGFKDMRYGKTYIYSLTALSDGSVMAGGGLGALYNITKDQNGNWQIGDLIPGFESDWIDDPATIRSLTPLPDGSVMAGGDLGALRVISRPEKTLEILKNSLQKIAEKKEKQ